MARSLGVAKGLENEKNNLAREIAFNELDVEPIINDTALKAALRRIFRDGVGGGASAGTELEGDVGTRTLRDTENERED